MPRPSVSHARPRLAQGLRPSVPADPTWAVSRGQNAIVAVTLCARIMEVCDGVVGRLAPGPASVAVAAVRARLEEPLRVAVAGRVKAGKSTLVNALLRQQVAPTGVGECTKVVTWYRYGHPERLQIVPHEGPTREVPFGADALLPASLGRPPEEIACLNVWLSNKALREMTIIDTPGLASAHDRYSQATQELLATDDASRRAVADADAVVFLLARVAREDDATVLAGFRGLVGGIVSSAVNAVGVLSKADKVGGGDPLVRARELAQRYAVDLQSCVAAVVPVVGLFAETAEAAVFTESDAAALRELAKLDTTRRELLLLSADRFASSECDVPTDARARLLRILDLHGVSVCLGAVDSGVVSASALVDLLSRLSGMERLRTLVSDTFARQADALKAAAAATALERLTYDVARDDAANAAVLAGLRDEIERVRLEPGMHRLEEIAVLQECASGRVRFSEELEGELRRVIAAEAPWERLGCDGPVPAAELARAALQGAARWRAVTNDPSLTPEAVRVAAAALRTFEALWEEADRLSEAAP